MKSNFEDLSRRVIRTSIDWSGVGLPLIAYLAGRFTYRSEAEWRVRIADSEILVNGEHVEPERILRQDDCVEYFPGDLPEPEADLHYRVAWGDESLLVIDKPGNLCVHPAGPFFKHTLWHLLCTDYGKIYLVNRLDRETSGLLIAARTPEIAAKLSGRNWPIRKEYLSLVFGHFSGHVEARGFLALDASSAVRKKRKFFFEKPESIWSETAATVFDAVRPAGEDMTLVRAVPETGRLHQIRATLLSLGYPVVGDKLYGPDEKIYLKLRDIGLSDDDRQRLRMGRQALHSALLEFRHPVSGETIRVESPLPEDFGLAK